VRLLVCVVSASDSPPFVLLVVTDGCQGFTALLQLPMYMLLCIYIYVYPTRSCALVLTWMCTSVHIHPEVYAYALTPESIRFVSCAWPCHVYPTFLQICGYTWMPGLLGPAPSDYIHILPRPELSIGRWTLGDPRLAYYNWLGSPAQPRGAPLRRG
jgi:hypothetical protein